MSHYSTHLDSIYIIVNAIGEVNILKINFLSETR
jgi:hypothetical protein